MIRYKTISIVVAAGTEQIEDALQSTSQVKRTVLALAFDDTAAAYGRAYIDQDQIMEVEAELVALTDQWFPVNRELDAGEVLSVGYFDGIGGGFTKNVMIKYEER